MTSNLFLPFALILPTEAAVPSPQSIVAWKLLGFALVSVSVATAPLKFLFTTGLMFAPATVRCVAGGGAPGETTTGTVTTLSFGLCDPGCAIMIVFPFIYFGMLDTRSLPLVFLAIVLSNPIQDIQYGPQAAFIAESFPGSVRYSGSALGYQLASITAGGPAPLIATLLLREYGTSTAIACYIAVCSVISLICVFLLKDHGGGRDHQ